MSLQEPTTQTTSDGFVQDADAYRHFQDALDPECNLFQCNECGHYVGHDHPRNFRSRCPECERQVKFYRIIA
jgi:rubrerythrin